ncbi:MFS transporter [Merdibacter massiliensis]|uniref:MFS transporter n=1 Tax=Merdibacter massiliensis TaxID=1871030 RepID=UPI00096AC037|nr:MFS transporter [Merdibacter massiliensis]
MNKKTKIIICILLISFVQMSTNGISAILVNIQNHFPTVPTSLVQLLMTFPSLFIIIFTMISAYLLRYFSKKKLIEAGLFLVCCAGVLSYFCYNSLLLLFVGAGLLGSGTGLCASFAISLISDYFAANERQKIMG